jgi:hypothetical protein
VQTPKRNRLSSKTLNDLVYLRVNLRLQQRLTDTNYSVNVAEWVEASAVDSDVDVDDSDSEEAATTPTVDNNNNSVEIVVAQ